MDIQQLRAHINEIDDRLIDLFVDRMQTSAEIARYKREHNLPVRDPGREREVLNLAAQRAGAALEPETRVLFNTLFDLSRARQATLNAAGTPLVERIQAALRSAQPFPQAPRVACQGVEGAYGQQACDKLFAAPAIRYFAHFEDVFAAVENGECEFGVLPIENSSAGSVLEVYDLMRAHQFSIARSARLRIAHSLLARPGAGFAGIREIVSHEQALRQCSEFLKAHPEIRATPVANTAVAAQLVAQSGRDDLAAIASERCAGLYDLQILSQDIQNSDNNYTRFICITRDVRIYPGANRMSFMLSLPHVSGSLYRTIARFAAMDMNLLKIESRPIPGRDFQFLFYFDIEADAAAERTQKLIAELDSSLDQFAFFGNYSEIF